MKKTHIYFLTIFAFFFLFSTKSFAATTTITFDVSQFSMISNPDFVIVKQHCHDILLEDSNRNHCLVSYEDNSYVVRWFKYANAKNCCLGK